MNYLIPMLLASQFLIFPGLSFRWAKEVSVQVIIIASLCSLIWKTNRPLALFIGWCCFLFFLNKSLIISDFGVSPTYKMNMFAFLNVINIVLFGIFYYILHQIKLNRDLIYKTFGFIAIVQSVYVILQKFGIDQFFKHASAAIDGLYVTWPVDMWGNETLVSWCLAICSPYLLAFDKLRYKIAYGVCGFAIFCTGSSTGLAAYFLGFVLWMFFNRKRYSRIIAISLITISLLGGFIGYRTGILNEYFNPTHRFAVWKKSVEIWKERPITGYGLGSFRQIFHRAAPEFEPDGLWAQAHNEYVQILFEQGIVGLGIILSLMWVALYSFWRKRKGLIPITSLFVFALISANGFPARTAMGILMLVSLVLFEREQCEEET